MSLTDDGWSLLEATGSRQYVGVVVRNKAASHSICESEKFEISGFVHWRVQFCSVQAVLF